MTSAGTFAAAAAIACFIIFRLIYRHMHTGFFLCLIAASLSLACACGALCTGQWKLPEAAADMAMAFAGIFMATASGRLNCSFRMAGESDD